MDRQLLRALLFICTLIPVARGAAPATAPADPAFTPLFNGRDLAGWVPVNVAPGTFSVRDGMVVSTGFPTGVMRTEKQYENFIIEMEWRHMTKGGNAGLFLFGHPITAPGTPFARGMEIQIIDGNHPEGIWTGHGDVFAIHGATFVPDRPHPRGWMRCLPSEQRANSFGQWNHYRVESRDGRVTLAVNGKVVSGGTKCVPRKGYVCLESEGAECHFRNIRIAELPSTNATAEETAPEFQGFRSIYTGLDLSGWKQDPGHATHWQPKDWVLHYDGQSTAADKNLWTEKAYGDFEMIVDYRMSDKPVAKKVPVILPSGDPATNDDGTPKLAEIQDAGNSGIFLRGSTKAQVNLSCYPMGSGDIMGYREDKTLPAAVRAATVPKLKADKPVGQWNRMLIRCVGTKVSVTLNEKLVIDNADLPGLPAAGPIGLQHHGVPFDFANVFVREVK